ncbi:SURF1 family protein [Duganella sp. FT92W]|uniref:SURF1-like protein n=1 Tax=Pseudoduganella rivuli TaxID=2666085 RepID=A0A7X2LUQ1_9BURK|nr:SURF1 family protein [Pseudoduganella rivuli]MRV73124.1 SURF1 family protein [Pseudoduganella rivuli]
MRPGFPIKFRFRLIPFIATVLLVALGVSLGQWQDRRAEYKMAQELRLQAGRTGAPLDIGAQPMSASLVEFRRVRMTGEFVAAWPIYLDNRPYQGRAGFYLLMPFKIAGTDMHVLVARGWLPRNMADRNQVPDYRTPSGTVTVEGVARLGPGQVMQLGTPPALQRHAIVQNATVQEVAAASGLRMQPFVVEQAAPAGPEDTGIVHDWPAPSTGVDKHKGYAFQWYGLALMALLFFVVTGFRRGKATS